MENEGEIVVKNETEKSVTENSAMRMQSFGRCRKAEYNL